MNDKIILCVGGDLRQLYAAKYLSGYYRVFASGLEKLPKDPDINYISQPSDLPRKADVLLLPLPASRDGSSVNAPFCGSSIFPSGLLPLLSDSCRVFGGRIPESFMKVFSAYPVTDYFENERLNIFNAQATAEGALALAVNSTDIMLFGSRIAVTGFGRIAKILAVQLEALGADVTVYARREDARAWAQLSGCRALSMDKLSLENTDIVFNTVPAPIIDKKILDSAKESCLIIDLASKPGGTDFEYAEKKGIRALAALGLPGKTAPKSAGELIGAAVREEIISDE